jgi:hypothetical protein
MVLVFSAVLVVALPCAAEGDKKERKGDRPIVGLVTATKETKEGKEVITAVTLTDKRGGAETVYNVVLDDNGRKLGEEMNGKRARVAGTIADKDGKKELTVQKYEELPTRPKGEKKPAK